MVDLDWSREYIVHTYRSCNSKFWWSHGHGCSNLLQQLRLIECCLEKLWESHKFDFWRIHRTFVEMRLFQIQSQVSQLETLFHKPFETNLHTTQPFAFHPFYTLYWLVLAIYFTIFCGAFLYYFIFVLFSFLFLCFLKEKITLLLFCLYIRQNKTIFFMVNRLIKIPFFVV